MGISRLRVELNDFPGLRTPLPVEIEAPEYAGTGDKHLVVDDVLAQACPATPAESVHADSLAHVRISR
ncbi:hypothetical protein RRF57_000341 [Xylaria bambusicola]|uniref:Uncharacterized protein n=1 Tax=Xylaria bambusicola TaxID=326684 RepID=A0AAN7UCP2_9PEZI